MGEDLSSGPDARNPDHTTCRNCGQPITWSEYSYVHDTNGFADCGIVISGGARIPAGSVVLTLNPEVTATMSTRAEPVEWDTIPKAVR